MSYIYSITHNTMGIVYIGMTTLPAEKRWKQHLYESRKKRPYMDICYLIKERGEDKFTFDVIEEYDSSIVYDRERYWIDYYDTYNNGYNNRRGGGYLKEDYKTTPYHYKDKRKPL